MGKKLLNYSLFLIAIPFLSGCNGPAKGETITNTAIASVTLHEGDGNYFKIDNKESVVAWLGSNTFGSHNGYVSISKGELMIEDGQLKEGTIEVSMGTIEDENHSNSSGLIKHLKDPDFFDVTLFPTSLMTITGVEPATGGDKVVTGNLTIKGITHPVSFPATVEVRDGIANASGKLVIDRTKWDIRYKSGKFFDNLKDQAIDDSITFNIKIVAKK